MSEWNKKRIAISTLLRAGKTINEIVVDLGTSRSTVKRVKRRTKDGKDPEASPRKKSARILTPHVVGGLKKRIRTAPTKSLRRVAKEAKVPRESVRRVVRKAGWRSLRKVKVPLISCLLYTSPSPRD